MDKINPTQYRAMPGETKPTIIVGGQAPDRFVPNINMGFDFDSGSEKRWINLNARDVVVKKQKPAELLGGVGIKVGHQEEQFVLGEDGRFRWKRVFHAHPKRYAFETELQCSDGVRFLEQRSLEELKTIRPGHQREPGYEGRYYAIYANEKDHSLDDKGRTLINWRTGRMGDILPPLFTDARGNTLRGELYIDPHTNLHRVEIDRLWLDKVVFPVVANDTFGFTYKASGSFASWKIVGTQAAPASSGTVTSMSMYLKNELGRNVPCNLGYYNNSGGGELGTHVAHGTAEQLVTAYDDWKTISLSGAITGGSVYYLVCQVDTNTSVREYEEEAGDKQVTSTVFTFDTWPDNPAGLSYYDNWMTSIYATYTPSGAPPSSSLPVIRQQYERHL